MNEKMFVRTELAETRWRFRWERHILRPGETIRAFVVEQRGARQGFSGKLESDLPVLENVKQDRKVSPEKSTQKVPAEKQEGDDER